MTEFANPDESVRKRRTALLLCAALVLTGSVYLKTLAYGFVYDDTNLIVNNGALHSWRYVPRYFTSHSWSHIIPTALYYRPVFLLWLRLNDAAWGLNPAGWHLAAIGLHLLATYLFYLLVTKVSGGSQILPVVAALLFGLHPAHVESVAWISGVTDPLLSVFLLGSVLCFIRSSESHASRDGWKWQAASWACCGLAILSKETAVILPGVILVYDLLYESREQSWLARLRVSTGKSLPFVSIIALGLILRTFVMRTLTAPPSAVPLKGVVLSWPNILVFYGRHLLFPARMSPFYDTPWAGSPWIYNFAIPVLLLLLVAAALYRWSRHSKLIALFSVWLALMFVPILDASLHLTSEVVHDRYLYLPSMAFAVFLATALALLYEANFAYARALACLGVAALAGWYGLNVMRETSPWMSDSTLAERALELYPDNPEANQMRGAVLVASGRPGDAIPFMLRALEKNPDSQAILWGLGFCYSSLDSLPEAEAYIRRALREDPAAPQSYLVLGIIRFKQNRLDDAETELRRSIQLLRIAEGFQYFHFWLGKVLYARGDPQGAIREYALEAPETPAGIEAQQEIEKITAALHSP